MISLVVEVARECGLGKVREWGNKRGVERKSSVRAVKIYGEEMEGIEWGLPEEYALAG